MQLFFAFAVKRTIAEGAAPMAFAWTMLFLNRAHAGTVAGSKIVTLTGVQW